MASPEENMAAALQRAADARAAGNESRAATWEASAARYQTIIDAKARIAKASENIAIIKDKLENPPQNKTYADTGKGIGHYWITTTDSSAGCPNGYGQFEIEYQDGKEIGRRLLNCIGAANKTNSSTEQQPLDVSPTPLTPSLISTTPVVSTPPPPPAKTAPIDTILFDNLSVPIEIMTDLIFENIGGQELINIARNDIINGQQVSYSPIKNLTSIQQQYNPNNIINLQSTSDTYFANFSIKLDEKIPNIGNGPNGKNIYIEPETGDLIIETINNANDEQLDIQIGISGTIYEADI